MAHKATPAVITFTMLSAASEKSATLPVIWKATYLSAITTTATTMLALRRAPVRCSNRSAELATGSELERGLALLITRRRLLAAEGRLGYQATMRGQPSAMGN